MVDDLRHTGWRSDRARALTRSLPLSARAARALRANTLFIFIAYAITYLLIGVIVAVYIWCLSIDHSLLGKWDSAPRVSIYMGANWPPPIHAEGQWWRTLSSVFLHGGLLHIGFNAYALYVLGPMVERLSGGARYFI